MSGNFKSIQSHGTASAFAPRSIASARSVDQFQTFSYTVDVTGLGSGSTMDVGVVPANCSLVMSSFVDGDGLDGATTYDVGLAASSGDPSTNLTYTDTPAQVNAGLVGAAGVSSSVNKFLTITSVGAGTTAGSVTVTLVAFCV